MVVSCDMKARKLLSKDTLELCWLRYSVGVPIKRLHRDFTINMSIPSFTNLVLVYEESLDQEQAVAITDTIRSSLFPDWLKDDCSIVQSQPKPWKYIGRFPLGSWLRLDNEDN